MKSLALLPPLWEEEDDDDDDEKEEFEYESSSIEKNPRILEKSGPFAATATLRRGLATVRRGQGGPGLLRSVTARLPRAEDVNILVVFFFFLLSLSLSKRVERKKRKKR